MHVRIYSDVCVTIWTFSFELVTLSQVILNGELFVALKIRLARYGAKKHPFYKIVVTDSRRACNAAFIEKIGSYDPFLDHDNPNRVIAKADRFNYWISVGATPSDRVALLLSGLGLCKKPEITESPKKSAPKKKAQERLAAEKAAAETAAQ